MSEHREYILVLSVNYWKHRFATLYWKHTLAFTAKLWVKLHEKLKLTHDDGVRAAQWNADESLILTSSSDGTARVWDAEKGTEKLKLTHDHEVWAAQWNKDGSLILTGSRDGTARVWDAETGKEILKLTHDREVQAVQWNKDERLILTGSLDNTARVWDAETGKEILKLTHDNSVSTAQWNTDERLILTSSGDRTARVWDAETGIEKLRLTHDDGVGAAQWNADESLILTSSSDGTARVWDAETGKEILKFTHDARVETAQWNADESLILTSSWDGTVRMWSTTMDGLLQEACKAAPCNMPPREWQQFMGDQAYRLTCPNAPIHPNFMKNGRNFARKGQIDEAIATYEAAQAIDPNLKIPTADWNTLCRFGSLWGYAAEVMNACEQAVELTPENGNIRDSRGLARALTGDYEGAIEDFAFYVQQGKDWDGSRQSWIESLQAGENPFDEETLETLRNKYK